MPEIGPNLARFQAVGLSGAVAWSDRWSKEAWGPGGNFSFSPIGLARAGFLGTKASVVYVQESKTFWLVLLFCTLEGTDVQNPSF